MNVTTFNTAGIAAAAANKRRVLLLLPVASYRNQDFLDAAEKLGIDVVSAADHCMQLAPQRGWSPIRALRFDQPEAAARQLLNSLGRRVDAVLAVDDAGVELAALLRQRLGLRGNTPEAAAFARDKLAFRRLLADTGLNCPPFQPLADEDEARAVASQLLYPVVVKARRLSAGRGVLRADDPSQFVQAAERVARIQRAADRDAARLGLLVEEFVPGAEYALEGLLDDGKLRVLALFDKPDPLDGPVFEESIYVTPSRLAPERQDEIAACVQRVCSAAGLASGPIHAEMRVNDRGIWLLEVAARSIGGLCGRMLRHRLGMSLEELILRDALGMSITVPSSREASGVMMIPLPRRGIYRGVAGLDDALLVPGIEDIRITAHAGQLLAPLPEGDSYLGFIFARAGNAAETEAALRASHARLSFDIQPDIPLAMQRD